MQYLWQTVMINIAKVRPRSIRSINTKYCIVMSSNLGNIRKIFYIRYKLNINDMKRLKNKNKDLIEMTSDYKALNKL